MPTEFTLSERFVGFALHSGTPNEEALVQYSELVPPSNAGRVLQVLEGLQRCVFSHIPNFPDPAVIRHLVVVVRQDLHATAYINELKVQALAQVTRDVEAGQPASAGDIASIRELNLGIEVPDDASIVVAVSMGWRRSVYFDFGPFTDKRARIGPLSPILAQQMLMMFGVETGATRPSRTRVDAMADGFQTLQRLLRERCEEEAVYQELLATHPWMLGGTYEEISRHREHGHDAVGRRNIPDFTATRSADSAHDIIELKQPFLSCFRQDGTLSAEFNDSWNQAERYLAGAREDRDYLRQRLGLRFENPKCQLIIGHDWTEAQRRLVRQKESLNLSITVMTWDQLVAQASQVLSLMRVASVAE